MADLQSQVAPGAPERSGADAARAPRRLRKQRRNGVAVRLDGWYVGRPGLFANGARR